MTKAQSIKWITWEEAFEKSKVEQRKIIVDIYTDWCTWCKKMDKTTFSDPVIVELINNHYYAIKFNAENKKPIKYQNQIYTYENGIWKGGYHQLAAKITNNQIKLPSIVFLDENSNVIQSIGGFRNALELELMAAYFLDDFHKSTPWKAFVDVYTAEKVQKKIEFDTSKQNTMTRMVSNDK